MGKPCHLAKRDKNLHNLVCAALQQVDVELRPCPKQKRYAPVLAALYGVESSDLTQATPYEAAIALARQRFGLR